MRILGIDPGLQKTGWGVIEYEGHKLSYVASGLIRTDAALPLYARLAIIDKGLDDVVNLWQPETAAVEETFVNQNPASALKLGFARGVAIVAVARKGMEVGEYPANLVKKSLTGTGHAGKDQMVMMIRTLMPSAGKISEDEADALGVAITHAHHASSRKIMGGIMSGGVR